MKQLSRTSQTRGDESCTTPATQPPQGVAGVRKPWRQCVRCQRLGGEDAAAIAVFPGQTGPEIPPCANQSHSAQMCSRCWTAGHVTPE
ncbi:hypothetical protein SKAU_G00043270 [Synaphobranchus kaupii]|uniref:Uncharacterized protein n=1 Tax=Synaphobranchus kaupii TaxID=118154 RepID=A0A9Q1G1K5_SYNKA|nr:hypothetical protein SKAU_G00043270 [Synaphobranchus kaupii]